MTADNEADGAIRRWVDEETGRVVYRVHYTALGPEAAERIRKKAAKYPGGIAGALWRADMECDLNAQPGDSVFPNFGPHNVEPVLPVPSFHHVLAFDFGYSPDPTCIFAAQVTPSQVQVYYEHYLAGATARVHKPRLQKGLLAFSMFQAHLGQAPQDEFFLMFTAIGDPSGPGYMAEYAEPPLPIGIGVPSTDPGARDRESNEAILDGLFRVMKRCCYRVWEDGREHCGDCKRTLVPAPGIVYDPRCLHAREEIPTQVVLENGRRAKVANHAVDASLYLARYCLSLRISRPMEQQKKAPWWLPRNKDAEALNEEAAMYGSNRAVVEFFR